VAKHGYDFFLNITQMLQQERYRLWNWGEHFFVWSLEWNLCYYFLKCG